MTAEHRAARLWIAATQAARNCRRRWWNYATLATDPAVAPDHPDAEQVHLALAQLADEYRLPIELHFFSGLSFHEAARQLDITIGQVRSRLRTALRRLEKLLSVRLP